MVAETAVGLDRDRLARPAVLVAIPIGFAVLGLLLRFVAYMQAGWEPHWWSFADGLCRWDCEWYANLARHGYDSFPVPDHIDAGNWAFFPLYPMLVGAFHALTRLPVMVVATSLSILASAAAAMVAWPLLERNLRAYTLYCAFLLCGPFSIYFTTFYTEVLFVLLTNCVLLALSRASYLAAGGYAALLAATRIVGVFMVFAIGAQYLLDYRGRGGRWRDLPAEIWRRPAIALAILIAPLGAFAYMAYLYFYMGDGLAFSHVQRAWGRVPGNPLLYLWIGLTDLPDSGIWPTTSQLLAIATLSGFALTAWLAVKRQYAAALFCFICLIVPISAGLASMLRFVVAMSPIVLALMMMLARWRPLYLVALLGFVAADYFFALAWLREVLVLV